MKMSELTLIIPAYDESPYIEECIISLKNQKLYAEIIITAAKNSTFLSEISNKFQIKLIINPSPDNTIADDWNFAINQCQTKYLVLAHQDDYYKPDFSGELIKLANECSDNLITFTFYDEKDSGGTTSNSSILLIKKIILSATFLNKNIVRSKFRKRLLLMFGPAIPCPAVMYNIQKLKNIRFDQNFKVNLDWDYWTKLIKQRGSIGFVNKSLMVHRIHSGSTTFTSVKSNIRKKEDMLLFKRLWYFPLNLIMAKIYTLGYSRNLNT